MVAGGASRRALAPIANINNNSATTIAVKKYFNLHNVEIIPCAINSLGLLEKRPLLINLDDGKFSSLIETKHFDIDYYLKAIDQKN